jgi:hypothetical protein
MLISSVSFGTDISTVSIGKLISLINMGIDNSIDPIGMLISTCSMGIDTTGTSEWGYVGCYVGV